MYVYVPTPPGRRAMATKINRLFVLLLFSLSPVLLHALARSKLSVHSGPSDGDATAGLVGGGQPRVIKLLDSFGNVDKYKSLAANITVIGRIYLPAR